MMWAVLLLTFADLLSDNRVAGFSSTTYSTSVYFDQSNARDEVDQACYESAHFWKDIDRLLPGWKKESDLTRFQEFCHNLQTATPGETVKLENGQQLLAQYIFPGLDGYRSAYPAKHSESLQTLQRRLEQVVAPAARREFSMLLKARPLVSDDEAFGGVEENDGDTWQRAAWYGWQFLPLRGAQTSMPKTTNALMKAMKAFGGPAHRFVGLARQKADCTGVEHSDGRNYMLSTLTPVVCPKEGCGIIVDGQEASMQPNGPTIVLDNTFPHHVFNHNIDMDRYCLMAECWHPSLTTLEINALSTLFAAKDRFTVTDLYLAPWGYDDESLAWAIKTGAVKDLDFWRTLNYQSQQASAKSVNLLERNSRKKKKGKAGKTNGGGFGK